MPSNTEWALFHQKLRTLENHLENFYQPLLQDQTLAELQALQFRLAARQHWDFILFILVIVVSVAVIITFVLLFKRTIRLEKNAISTNVAV